MTLPIQSPFRRRVTVRPRSLRSLGRNFRQPIAMLGLVLAITWIAVAIFAPLLAPYDPLAQSFVLFQHPSSAHLFGTDELGRDVLSRVIYGARLSLPLAVLLVALSVLVGTLLGLVAGYFGGWIDGIIMRFTDLVFAFPAIILAMVVTAALGPSIRNAVLALVIVNWPNYARVVRGLVLSTADAEYVQASRLLGVSAPTALFRVVLPNVIGPVIVLATLDLGNAILLLAALSYLGLGAQPPTAEWGQMISSGTQYFQDWWLSTFPGLAIFTAVLAFNFLGDNFRDMFDPRTARVRGIEG